MNILVSLSVRNLFRQKRRNLLLGIALAFGMMILVVANSFSHGISDNLLNKVIVYMTGHLEVAVMEKSRPFNRIIRDRDRMIASIRSTVTGIKEIKESIGIFTKLIGNAGGENSILVGILPDAEFHEYMRSSLIEGKIDDFLGSAFENPIIIYADKAKALHVKLHDTLNVRMKTITGQEQSARLTVSAILKSNNVFESMAVFINLHTIKSLLKMRPWETGALQVNFNRIDDPRHVIREADRLQRVLQPGLAMIQGTAYAGDANDRVQTFGISLRDGDRAALDRHWRLHDGVLPASKTDNTAMITQNLSDSLQIGIGDSLTLTYQNRFDANDTVASFQVTGIGTLKDAPNSKLVLLNEDIFYKTYLANLPKNDQAASFKPDTASDLYPILCPEWRVLPRSGDQESFQKKLQGMTRTRWPGPSLDVRTMYETASQVLDLENALKIITVIAVLILFFIILIGVINTLRMTIRERTREIGTVRAIGMQRRDVRTVFILETLMLSFFSCMIGIAAAFGLMGLLGLFTINTTSVFSILLVNKHLYFMPKLSSIIGNLLLILLLTAITAYFPARRAANLSAANALRHFE